MGEDRQREELKGGNIGSWDGALTVVRGDVGEEITQQVLAAIWP